MENKMETAQEAPRKEFDLIVHKRDVKTGRIVEVNPYTLEINQGVQIYTRAGKKYYPNGDLVPGQKPDEKAPVHKEPNAVAPAAVVADPLMAAAKLAAAQNPVGLDLTAPEVPDESGFAADLAEVQVTKGKRKS
jgi:hypothetical protein